MLLEKYYDGLELHRQEKIIIAKFLVPHKVISTCRAAGGLSDDFRYVYNYQACEPAGHPDAPLLNLAAQDPSAYRNEVAKAHNLEPKLCATLMTAANMRHAAVSALSFKDLTVVAVVTAGVEGNAGRIGDPAGGYEGANGYEDLTGSSDFKKNEDPNKPGTINTMLFINKPLTAGALTRTIMTATEAKVAALQELAVNSRYSDGLATGTGTDQIAVAAAYDATWPPITSAGKHSKLGELIGKTVKEAVKASLLRQNGMTPSGQCSIKIHLERFGTDTQKLIDMIAANLSASDSELLRSNYRSIIYDPLVVAAVAALAHLKDKFTWQILPAFMWSEIMAAFAAQAAAAVSGSYGRIEFYRTTLAPLASESSNDEFLRLICRALALGYADKWKT